METIEIKSMTSIEDAVKLVLHTAKLSGSRVVAEFNGFILDSKNSYDKNLDLYWAYMGRADRNVNWEQRRYEIAKTMLPAIYTDDGNAARADHSPINGFEYKRLMALQRINMQNYLGNLATRLKFLKDAPSQTQG